MHYGLIYKGESEKLSKLFIEAHLASRYGLSESNRKDITLESDVSFSVGNLAEGRKVNLVAVCHFLRGDLNRGQQLCRKRF